MGECAAPALEALLSAKSYTIEILARAKRPPRH
jgi:hypothetical protein